MRKKKRETGTPKSNCYYTPKAAKANIVFHGILLGIVLLIGIGMCVTLYYLPLNLGAITVLVMVVATAVLTIVNMRRDCVTTKKLVPSHTKGGDSNG